MKMAGWRPVELLDHEAEEIAREEQEGIRVAYVAATRARDLLVVPAVGDEPFDEGWVSSMNAAIYPPIGARKEAAPAPGCPVFKSRDTVFERPNGDAASEETVAPGLHRFGSVSPPDTASSRQPAASGLRLVARHPQPAASGPQSAARSLEPDADPYSVVWWDPSLLVAEREHVPGLRREELIAKNAPAHVVSEGLAAYKHWQQARAESIGRAANPSLVVQRAGEWAATAQADSLDWPAVEVLEVERSPREVGGRRFGVLLHAVLAQAPLDADRDVLEQIAEIQGRVLGAAPPEIEAAAVSASRVLASPTMDRARVAERRGCCRRETPVTLTTADGVLVEGIVDLAFEDQDGWTVVDFKTDQELSVALDRYKRQVGLYAEAIRRATAQAVRVVLMRV
jgi:ATP-dependent exoDNAse (exonuclease V) beta subunit